MSLKDRPFDVDFESRVLPYFPEEAKALRSIYGKSKKTLASYSRCLKGRDLFDLYYPTVIVYFCGDITFGKLIKGIDPYIEEYMEGISEPTVRRMWSSYNQLQGSSLRLKDFRSKELGFTKDNLVGLYSMVDCYLKHVVKPNEVVAESSRIELPRALTSEETLRVMLELNSFNQNSEAMVIPSFREVE